MARVFSWEFDVRSYELNASGHVHTATLHNYLEETATRGSADAGFGYRWYFDRGHAWVVREMTVRYLAPLTHGDRVRARTWVSDFRRIYSHREYDLRRAADDRPVVRARAKWVYVTLDTMRPVRIPAEFESAFQPTGELEPLPVRLRRPVQFVDSPQYRSGRQAQRYELDPAAVVNNAIYVKWFEQAMFDAFAQAGWDTSRLDEIGVEIVQWAHQIEYLRPAFNGDPVVIISQPIEMTRTRGAWRHEARHAETGQVLAADYSVGAFLNRNTGRPCSFPAPVLEALLAGRSAGGY